MNNAFTDFEGLWKAKVKEKIREVKNQGKWK